MQTTPFRGGASEISNCSTATYVALFCILIKHHIPKLVMGTGYYHLLHSVPVVELAEML